MTHAPSLSPATLARLLPFALFMALLALRGYLPADLGVDARWIYALQTLAVGGLLAWFWRDYGELARQNLPDAREVGWAVVVGIVVFALWVRLDAPWMQLGEPTASFVPLQADGSLHWPLIVFRLAGAALVVPLMEELFWRSWLMRWLERPGFEGVDPQHVGLKAIVLSTFVFTLAHTLWLAAILAGLAYALLYRWSGRLWTAVIAHAVTNGLLGLWVIASHRWEFW
ncbi:MAG: CAAX prenyl protease-related protein [Roseateles sp.]|nr:MAG: CAAX prenyl protease-related protein [Roseateles sp.]